MNKSRISLGLLFITVLAFAGCASIDAPDDLFSTAKTLLDQAKSSGAEEYAPTVYRDASTSFSDAETAMKESEYTLAKEKLERSIADSEYAIAQSAAEKMRISAEEVNDNLNVLEREVNK